MSRIDVSTRAAVVQYLRSIHVNPTGVVIQRSAHNYAGSSCPGKAWSCTTTTHPVVQVAAAGGMNSFNCTSGSCAVVQVATAPAAGVNTAKCIKTTGLGQSCTISQTSSTKDNLAIVYEDIQKSSGLTQTASSTASITQQATGATNGNTTCVTQNIKVDGSTVAKKGTPVNVALEAHQTVTIAQDALGSGANSAQTAATSAGNCGSATLGQSQTLTSTAMGAGPITQSENAANSGANMTIDIEQNQGTGYGVASGLNNATFTQTNLLKAIANSQAGPISQTQSSVNGGLLGTVNQDSSGVSTAIATQTETQCEDAAKTGLSSCGTSDADADEAPASLTQIQYGPVHKGVGTATQTGNGGDTFTVSQTSTQDDDQGAGSQQTNVIQGDCSTPGNCTVEQTTNIDGQSNTNTQSGQDVSTQTTCSGTECTSTGPSLTFLADGLSVSNTDIGEFGYGGMRGIGTGSIDVNGISGPVFRAFLYWNGPTNSAEPDSNAAVDFNGTPITGTNIGTSYDNNWGFQNSQSYRADVTGLVSGDGTYTLDDFLKTDESGTVADINGVSLIVFYDDSDASDDRNVVLWNGNDSNCTTGAAQDSWDETITGVAYPGSGNATLDFIVGDGQNVFDDPQLLINGDELVPAGPNFQGDSTPFGAGGNGTGSLWDVKPFDLTPFLDPGSNDLHLTTGTFPNPSDCLSLVVAAANVPASSGPIIESPLSGPATSQAGPALHPRPASNRNSQGFAGGGGVR